MGAEYPPDAFPQEILADLTGKKRQGEKGKWRKEGQNCKREGWNWRRWRIWNWAEDLFFLLLLFFFVLFTIWNHWNWFGVYQNGNLYREKVFHTEKKIGRSDFAPPEKYSSYATRLFPAVAKWLDWFSVVRLYFRLVWPFGDCLKSVFKKWSKMLRNP